jgi:hypothetical protein
MPRRYRIELATSVVPQLHRLTASEGKRLEARLLEVAEAAAGLPPPGHAAWRRWVGLGVGCFSISLAGWRCSYVLDRTRRRVLVLALRSTGDGLRAAGAPVRFGRAPSAASALPN